MRRRLLLITALTIAATGAVVHEAGVGKVGAPAIVNGHAEAAARPAHGARRNRWKGGGVYLDGAAIGMLRYAELPRGLVPVWETQRRRLPFRAGEPVRELETRVRRFRVVDYLAAIGVPLPAVTEVHFHGGRNAAIVVRGEELRRHPDAFLFRFADETAGKPIPVVRDVPVNTSFDNLEAMAIYVARKPPTLTADQGLELDDEPVRGIPYRGQPIREGIRVYRDDRLVALLKRNQMTGATGSRLGDVLARAGVSTDAIDHMELIHGDERSPPLAWGDGVVAFDPAVPGEIAIGARPANAIALYTARR